MAGPSVHRVERFRGLWVPVDPREVPDGAWTSGLNADVRAGSLVQRMPAQRAALMDAPGGVVPATALGVFYRDGYDPQVVSLWSGHWQAFTAAAPYYDSWPVAYNVVGPVLSGSAGGRARLLRFGTPGGELLLRVDGLAYTFTDATGAYDPGGLTGMGAPYGRFVARTPWDNRVVLARCAGAGGPGNNRSTVRFSEPDDPRNFIVDRYNDLDAGDGEEITAAITFADKLLIFKRSKFYKFYGTGKGADGGPLFQYQPVDAGVGAYNPDQAVATPDGVIFLAHDGIYLTTGGRPTRILSQLDGAVRHGLLIGTRTWSQILTTACLRWAAGRLLILGGAANDVICWDPSTDAVTVHDIGGDDACELLLPDGRALIVLQRGPELWTWDPQTAYPAAYRDESGLKWEVGLPFSLPQSAGPAVVRRTIVHGLLAQGAGALDNQMQTRLDSDERVGAWNYLKNTLDPRSGRPDEQYASNVAQRGRDFTCRLGAPAVGFYGHTIHRLEHHVQWSRRPDQSAA